MGKIEFGSFNGICETAALVVCPLVGTDQGIEPTCYSRNVDIGGTLIFQPSTCFVHIVAIIMTAIMIYHIRSKYTAVGRKEIVTFFWLYAVIELLAMFLDSGIIPTANVTYPWFTAVYAGLVAAAYTCLLINGFVGFQFAEDGTPLSLWFLRISCLVVFGLQFFLAIATFKQIAGFNYTKPIALWIVYILWPLICTVVYIISQLVLVFRTLEDRWPIGDIVFGTAFFAIAQVLLFAFSTTICDAIKHYIDGLFFFTLCILLSVMMVYKYWDSITKEDLEFSVGSKAAVWEVKDPLLAGNGPGDYAEEDTASNYHGGAPASLVGGYSGQQLYAPQGQKSGYRGYPPTEGRY
ncbi:chitin synthase III catalytic subunit [Lyophyllum atratum]|nr:chitin synthase III catalytic subunit [Lyophyllum atratum]